MRILFTFLVLISSNLLSAQKTKHSRKEIGTFPYSYKCEGKDYVKIDIYSFQLTQLNEDSLLLTGDGGTDFLHGTIRYSQDTLSNEITTENGKFLLKIPNITSTSPFIIELEFETHETTDVWLNWSKEIPRGFFLETPRKSIFDPESPYIIVNSKKELSQAELKELITCLSTTKNSEKSCFDTKIIRLIIPI